jgi:signal recognition particle GTPase
MAEDFTLDDFRRHLDQFQKMGMKDLLGRMPGLRWYPKRKTEIRP